MSARQGRAGAVPWRVHRVTVLGNGAIADQFETLAVEVPAAARAAPRVTERARGRAILWAACALLLAVPFLCVRFPPVTDLPQHLAQVRLLHETLADPASPYRVQWLTPYALGYLPLAAAWALTPSETAGRV